MCEFRSLVSIMEKLRSPEGCPWDRIQTHKSLRQYLIEEAYEVLEKIDTGDSEGLKEELGDLLFQIVFQAQIAKENSAFTIDDVISSIKEKMLRRHPHVFGCEKLSSPEEVSHNWERIKEKEKGTERDSLLDGIPTTLPALHRAHKLTKRAAKVGFDWEKVEQIFDKLTEEVKELKEAIKENDPEKIEDEVGDLLFVAANISRFLGINPEIALINTNRKFERRFKYIEKILHNNGESIDTTPLERMEELWTRAKQIESMEDEKKYR